jgi:hypothetical protein
LTTQSFRLFYILLNLRQIDVRQIPIRGNDAEELSLHCRVVLDGKTEGTVMLPTLELYYGIFRYSIQNKYLNWQGGYLDAYGDPANCPGNLFGVTTCITPIRVATAYTGLWVIKSAEGRRDGSPVRFKEKFHLVNQYGAANYLDLCGVGCQGNKFCVSTSKLPNRYGLSGTWSLYPEAEGKVPHERDPVLVRSEYEQDLLLDAKGKSQGNLYCVSIYQGQPLADFTTTWRFSSQFPLP